MRNYYFNARKILEDSGENNVVEEQGKLKENKRLLEKMNRNIELKKN